jgi:hypothetical protein
MSASMQASADRVAHALLTPWHHALPCCQTFKTFFAWYVHQLERRDQHAGAREEDLASRASTINNAIKAGKRSAQQVGPEVRTRCVAALELVIL